MKQIVDDPTQAVTADPAPATQAPVETTAAPVQQGDTGTPETPQTPETQGAEPTAAEKRIQQLVARSHDAERREQEQAQRAAYWEGVARGRIRPDGTPVAPAQPQEEQPPQPPDPDKYGGEWTAEYDAAKTAYIIEKAKYDTRKEMREEFKRFRESTAQDRQRQEQTTIADTYRAKMTAAAAIDPEITRIENDTTLPVSGVMAAVIQRADAPDKLLRYLNGNRAEAARIAALPPIDAGIAMARLEARLSASQPQTQTQTRTVSQAPEPARTVGGTGGNIDIDEEKLPMEEFARRRNAHEQEAKKKGAW